MLTVNFLHCGNCLDLLKDIDDDSVDAIITDPPYELGFMGKSWDSTGIANNVEMWKECFRILKPGGYLLSFGGTRTYHRMAVAIEDAGFEIRDMIEWIYGSGFPKSHNIGKSVDKLQGNEREWISENPNKASEKAEKASAGKCQSGRTTHPDITKGTSKYEGWGTALKPAHEPICMARKPLSEKTVAENVLKHGTGGINIDESRVDFVSKEDKAESTGKNKHAEYKNSIVRNSAKNKIYHPDNRPPENYEPQGRFPANLIHDGSEEVKACFPNTKGGGAITAHKKNVQTDKDFASENVYEFDGFSDSGNASRYFKSIIYQPKASKKERGNGNIHPTVKPVALMEYLVKMVTREGAIILDPFMGSGTTAVACKQLNRKYIGIELSQEYCDIANKRLSQKNLLGVFDIEKEE